jgi:hypothetical protein
MKNNHARAYQEPDRGICSGCDHAPICLLQRRDHSPVFFCEEFACAPKGPEHSRANVYSLPGCYEGRIVVRRTEQARTSYIGLCRNCSKLASCPLLKPGGGTWECDSYEEDPMC